MAFPNNCSPRVIAVDDSCGCALTRASIRAMTPQDFEDQGFKEVGMDRIIAQTKEARMTGVPENAMADLLMSRTVPIKTVNMGQGASIIAPFVLTPQEHRINANFFTVESGAANGAAGTGSIPASAWDITVKNHGGTFASPLKGLERYFLPGRYITVLNKDASGGTGRSLQYRIVSAVNANAGGVEKAKLTIAPNYSAAGWTGLSAGDKTIYQTTHGVVVPLANSVSDYEAWCANDATDNTMKLLTHWKQTIRETHCFNDEYLKALTAPLTSEYFKKFRQIPLAKQKKQQALLAERAYFNTIWFGQRINELQAVETYTSLPQVVDPANTGCVMEYKANTLGIETQLSDCSRVIDFMGGRLDFDTIKGQLNTLMRTRSAGGAQITRIEAMTDRFTASNVLTMMIDYYKKKYGVATERFYKVGEALKFENQVLWNYNTYEFPDEGVELSVIVDPFFDDYLAAFPSADKSRGRYFTMVDWSDVQIGLAGTASVTRQTNVADNLYNCVIRPNINHYQLTSKTIAVMLQDPNRSLIYRNFSDYCPGLTVASCSVS